jgi:hypothetical protein
MPTTVADVVLARLDVIKEGVRSKLAEVLPGQRS